MSACLADGGENFLEKPTTTWAGGGGGSAPTHQGTVKEEINLGENFDLEKLSQKKKRGIKNQKCVKNFRHIMNKKKKLGNQYSCLSPVILFLYFLL